MPMQPSPRAETNGPFLDRKSTRLNSSHLVISYAVFCLKKNNHAMCLDRPAHRQPVRADGLAKIELLVACLRDSPLQPAKPLPTHDTHVNQLTRGGHDHTARQVMPTGTLRLEPAARGHASVVGREVGKIKLCIIYVSLCADHRGFDYRRIH